MATTSKVDPKRPITPADTVPAAKSLSPFSVKLLSVVRTILESMIHRCYDIHYRINKRSKLLAAAVSLVAELIRAVFATVMLASVTTIAVVTHWTKSHANMTIQAAAADFKTTLTSRLPARTVYTHCRRVGYELEDHTAVTVDGFHITLQRLRKRTDFGKLAAVGTAGPVLLMHGLFNTAITFTLHSTHRALAFALLDNGHDVFMANSRASAHSLRHERLSRGDVRYWSWTIDELVYDVAAAYKYILNLTSSTQLIAVGHSQGTTQMFAALASIPALNVQTRLFIALAPAVFINPLPSNWLLALGWLYQYSPTIFYATCGEGPFMQSMIWSRPIVPPLLWSYLGSAMFHYLFDWSAEQWENEYRPLFFQEIPSIGSSKQLIHWIQQSSTGKFARFDGSKEKERRKYASPYSPLDNGMEYDLSRVTAPIALVAGGYDRLLNMEQLRSRLSTIVYDRTIAHYYHLDTLNARDAPDILYPDLMQLIRNTPPASASASTSIASASMAPVPVSPLSSSSTSISSPSYSPLSSSPSSPAPEHTPVHINTESTNMNGTHVDDIDNNNIIKTSAPTTNEIHPVISRVPLQIINADGVVKDITKSTNNNHSHKRTISPPMQHNNENNLSINTNNNN